VKKVKARFPNRRTTLCLLSTFLVTSLLIGNVVLGPVQATTLQEEEMSEAVSLTYNNANDDLPASVVYNNTLYLVWESNRDQNKELYLKTFDGNGWSPIFRITENEAEDGGPALVVYNGLLYLFWHSRRDDSRRDVYYKTYNGEQWSEAIAAVENAGVVDDFADVAVYNNKLYLAWTSGRTGYYDLYYKTFNGSSWSMDIRLTDDPDPDLHPALESFDGKLFLEWHSYGYGADSWEKVWKTFDGIEWSNIKSITNNQAIDEGPGDLEVYQQKLYLSFSSDRDNDKEIYYTVYSDGNWSSVKRITDNPAQEWHSSLTVFNDTLYVFFQSDRESNNDIYYKVFGEIPPPTQPTLPTADFTWTPYAPVVNETVLFDASVSSEGWNGSHWDPIVSYQWDFGDNNTATGETVTHTFDEVGNYTVRLNVTDSRGVWDIEEKEIAILADPSTDMHVSLESSTSYVGFKVAINGNLTNNEEGVSGAPILLSYSVTGGDSWNEITLVYTTNEGTFSAIWLPSATGCYLVKASWAGNSTFLESNTVVSLSVIGVEDEKVFSVTSNSTLTQLAFNSTDRVLVFSVSGASGTAGYTRISMAKTLIGNEEQLKVYFDGNQVNFTSQETEDAFQIIFTYYHSTHKVVVTLGSVPSSPPQLITPLSLVLLATGLAIVATLSVWRIRKGTPSKNIR